MAGRETVFPASPLTTHRGGGIVSPVQFILTGEDGLRVSSVTFVANLELLIVGRHLAFGAAAPTAFSFRHVCSQFGSETSTEHTLAEGTILNLVVIPANAYVRPGECFVRVDVIRGRGAKMVVGTVIAGNVGYWGGRAWPGSPLESPVDGPGRIRLLEPAGFAAGIDPFISQSAGLRWRVMSVLGHLQTSAAVATRTPHLILKFDLVQEAFVAQSNFSQAASDGRYHSWLSGGTGPAQGTLTTGHGTLPTPLVVSSSTPGEFKFAFLTAGLQAGDQWSDVRILVEEWLEPTTEFDLSGAHT